VCLKYTEIDMNNQSNGNLVKSAVFSDVTQCSLVAICHHVGGTFCSYLKGGRLRHAV
jgi:hypothetical protein